VTLGTQVTYAKRRARVSSNSVTETATDDVVRDYLNDGVQELCRRVGGLSREQYLLITPNFSVQSNFAIRLTVTGGANAVAATDLPIASASYWNVSAGILASIVNDEISNTLAVSMTLSWDSADWVLSIRDNALAATAIEIGVPSSRTYIDSSGMIFGRRGTANSTYFEGSFPLDCTLETTLPSDFLQIEYVEWDGEELAPAPYDLFLSPSGTGDPRYYAIKNKRIRLNPCPNSQKTFLIRYKAIPDDLVNDGTDDAVDCPLPAPYDMLPVYWATAMLLQEMHEFDKARESLALFQKGVVDYKVREDNQNPTLFPSATPSPAPTLVT